MGLGQGQCISIHVLDDFLQDRELVARLNLLQPQLRPDAKGGAAIWTVGAVNPRVWTPQPVMLLVEQVLRSAWAGMAPGAVEYWSNVMRPGEQLYVHQDKNEALFQMTGEVVTPIFSAVYYPHVVDVVGGELELPGTTILPRSNRAVVFTGHLQHRVSAVREGTRRSIVLNGWRDSPTS